MPGRPACDGSRLEALDEGVGVIAFVAEEGFGLRFGDKGFSLGDVVGLAVGEAERQRVAQGVDDHVDLGGWTAARPAYGLVDWSMAPVVEAFQAMRGTSFLVAVTFAVEVGDARRFDTPRQLMSLPRSCPNGTLDRRHGPTRASR